MVVVDQTVVQRSYNALAVRVQTERGKVRRAVPVSETTEGDLCIEMRIRLYRDGLMSKQLSQLIKVRTHEGITSCGSRGGRRGSFARRPRESENERETVDVWKDR